MLFKVTPVPIPNTMVKLLEVDGTARATVWESRSLPAKRKKPVNILFTGFFSFLIKKSHNPPHRRAEVWLIVVI